MVVVVEKKSILLSEELIKVTDSLNTRRNTITGQTFRLPKDR